MSSQTRKPGYHIAWKTVTYRSVALLIMAGVALFLIAVRLTFPQFTENSIKAVGSIANKALQRVAGMAPAAGSGVSVAQQAHFTALDGTVRVKKGNGNSWVGADYNVPLEKGDVVQTGSEGMAKVVFNDGTSYTVKQDSLIVIEENSANDQQQTNVAVAVSTGTVDLSTATYSQGSKSQVIVAGATASLSPQSTAQVRNDPKMDQHEILMKKGAGEVTRNGETVQLTNWEKVSFKAAETHMEKAKGTLFDTSGQESKHRGCHGYEPRRRSVLLDGAVIRRVGERVGGEREEPVHDYFQGKADRGHCPGTGPLHSTWARD